MELRGLEPLTSSMPWKRATNCAKAPRVQPDEPPATRPILHLQPRTGESMRRECTTRGR